MKFFTYITGISILLCFLSCSSENGSGFAEESQVPNPEVEVPLTDEELLDFIQKETFKYFWDFAHPSSGAARERYHPSDPSNDPNTVTMGGTGFGLMAILVGIERNYVSRTQAVTRVNKILSFLENADRFRGAWPHWLDGNTGRVRPFSPRDNGGDLVETALLAQGLICIKEYFKNGSESEQALAAKADELWKEVEWNTFTQHQNALFWHWSPSNGFDINLMIRGYNETLITYVLAAASPNYSISKEVYQNGWANNGGIRASNSSYGYPLVVRHGSSQALGGPLFYSHYSFLGLNPIGLADEYVNYGTASINHSFINYNYAVQNPKRFRDYGRDCWGLTASYTRNSSGGIGYMAHSPANDTGVISPTAAISSIPYTPEESIRAMRYFYKNRAKLLGPAGFYDAFSPQFNFWVADAYLAIDQGPQIIMIENYRTGFFWKLFMQNEEVKAGLIKLGFTYAN